jgi:hypothetical protein
MGWSSHRASRRGLAYVAILGVGGLGGLVAGFNGDTVPGISVQNASVAKASVVAENLTPAEVVALRFPADWTGAVPAAAPANLAVSAPMHVASVVAPVRAQAPSAPARAAAPRPQAATPSAPARYVVASADEQMLLGNSLMFAPYPTYGSSPSSADAAPLPDQALAYGSVDAGDRIEAAVPAPRPAAAPTPPVKHAALHPASQSNTLLNNAQIASIRERLKLSSYQEQYWPPVESALRAISYRAKSGRKNDPRSASIDVTSPEVQQLKSAAVPLIMTMREEQKEEVRNLARLMGLENLAAQF